MTEEDKIIEEHNSEDHDSEAHSSDNNNDEFTFSDDSPLNRDDQKSIIEHFNKYEFSKKGAEIYAKEKEDLKRKEIESSKKNEELTKRYKEAFSDEYKSIIDANNALLKEFNDGKDIDINDPIAVHKALSSIRSEFSKKPEEPKEQEYKYEAPQIHKKFSHSSGSSAQYSRSDLIDRIMKGENITKDMIKSCN